MVMVMVILILKLTAILDAWSVDSQAVLGTVFCLNCGILNSLQQKLLSFLSKCRTCSLVNSVTCCVDAWTVRPSHSVQFNRTCSESFSGNAALRQITRRAEFNSTFLQRFSRVRNRASRRSVRRFHFLARKPGPSGVHSTWKWRKTQQFFLQLTTILNGYNSSFTRLYLLTSASKYLFFCFQQRDKYIQFAKTRWN